MSSSEGLIDREAEQAMRESFEQQVEEILESAENYEVSEGWKIGLETEYPLVDRSFNPVSSSDRDELIEDFDFADVEVGGSQVEIRTEPVIPESLSELEQLMSSAESDLEIKASEQGLKLLRSGAHPFVDLESIPISSEEKYQKVPPFHERNRHRKVHERLGIEEVIDPRDADLAAVINSTQVNVQAEGLEDAVEKANYTYMISPFMSAISGNARFVGGKDTGLDDARMPIWEKSHDIRDPESLEDEKHVGELDSYYGSEDEDVHDLRDYFERVKRQPFILNDEEKREDAREIGIGTFWKDSRIKFNHEPEEDIYEAVVESRIVSTQPSVAEEVAMHGFYIGRLAYAQNKREIEVEASEKEQLLDIEKVNRNRSAAVYNGLDTKLYDTSGELRDAREVLEEELDKAVRGLDYTGIDGESYLELLYDRLEEGTPSDLMAEGFNNALEEGETREEALERGLEYQRR